jgi:hypothetical protein
MITPNSRRQAEICTYLFGEDSILMTPDGLEASKMREHFIRANFLDRCPSQVVAEVPQDLSG